MRSKLSVRLALLFLAASLLPLVGAAWLSLRLMGESLHVDAARRHGEVAQLCASMVEVWMDTTEDKLKAVAEVMRVDLAAQQRSPDPQQLVADLEALRCRIEPLIDSNENWSKAPLPAYELQLFGNGLVTPEEDPDFLVNVQQTGWNAMQTSKAGIAQQAQARNVQRLESELVKKPMEESTPWRESCVELFEDLPTLGISVPLGAGPDNFGTLVADIDFTDLREILEQIIGEGYQLKVSDGAGTPIFDLGAQEGELIGHSQAIGSSDWKVSVAESRERIEAPLGHLRGQALLWMGLAALFAVALSFGLSAGITRPILALRRAAETMERGDLKARTGLVRSDEIGQLAAAFDRMAASLDQLDEAKSEFVGNVSHELRTPLTSMRLSVANLLDGVVGELSERQRETLARLRRELDRMIELVNELLEMARLEAGGVEPSWETVDLAALARECAEARRAQAGDRSVQLEVTGAGTARADSGMLRRVIGNLVDNAIKFSPAGGQVRIEVEPGRLRVADQGPGLTDDGLFEKFRQGSEAGVKNSGVGLGLAIVRKLVTLGGGEVRAEAGPEGGAVFVVELPEAGA